MAMTTAQQTDAYRFFSIAFDAAPGVTYMNQLAEAYGAGMTTKQIVNVFTTKEQFTSKYPNFLTTETFAANLINNVVGTSATDAAKAEAVADVVAAIKGGMTRGDVIFQIFSNLAAKSTDDAKWGDTADLLANKVAVAKYVTETQLLNTADLAVLAKTLSAVTAATDTTTTAGIVAAINAGNGLGGNDYGVNMQLTRDRDSTDPTAKQTNQTTNIIASTDGNDFYSGTVDPANAFNNTVNNDDFIDGGKGVDTLTLALLGSNTSNARVKNVENLVLGTNVGTPLATAAGITYDLNINAGGQQTTGYQTIAADRIIAGEVLTVANVFKGTADAALPKLIWDNASNTTVAGVVNYNYLSGQTTGTADTQAIDLRSVNAGVLNIAAGIETFSVTSGTGINPVLNAPNTEANTLATTNNNANNPTGSNTGANADLASGNTLTKVVVAGGANFGAAAGIVATTGLTDRAAQGTGDNGANVAANDRGITATATAANLVSLANTVTTYDASAATGAQNVMFTAKASGVETNVTFIGGTGNDYVEFQVGNINATGGEGSDTFAFVNTGFNSTFTTADTIVGGAGTDTIQLGLNGVGGIDVQWTEFNSKTGVDVLDLRANTNKVELSDAFVAAAEVAGGMVVRTDKIVQTSAASVANPAGGSTVEDASVNTINLTKLASNRVITFEGGSGSDRLVLNEQSFTSNATLKGGDHVNNAGPSVQSTAGDYDTLTVIDNAVLSRGDLSKTSGFEGLVLVKSDTTSNRQFSVEVVESFLLANTLGADNLTSTSIDDTVFQIGTTRASNSNALGAGDTVTIDITDLFSGGVYKTSLAGRGIDVSTLTASGATVNFTFNNAPATAPQIAAVTKVNAAGQTDVIGASPAVPGTALPLNVIGTTALTSTGFGIQAGVTTTGGNDVINVTTAGALVMAAGSLLEGGAGGVDTLNVANGADISASTMGAGATLIENLVFATAAGTAVTMTAAQHAGFTAITASAGADTITLTTAAAVTGAAGVETYNLAAGGAFTYGATTPLGVVVNGTVGNEVVTVAGFAPAGAANLALGGGADTIVATTGANISGVNAGALTTAEALTLTGTITMTAAQYGDGATTGLTTAAITAAGGADRVNISDVFASAIGARATAVETVALQAAGNDTANVTTGVAGSFVGTLDISAGGTDTITLTNAAHNAVTANSMTLAGFTATAGANMDVIRVVEGVTAISGPLTAVNAGANTNYGGAVNSVIEIENGGVVNLADVADGGTVEVLIANAIGTIANGSYTFVVYGGTANSNAGIYSVVDGSAGDAATGDITVELLGIVTGVGANNLTGANFAI